MADEFKVLLHAMQDAGDAIKELQRAERVIATKKNNDIVTKADLLINEILRTRLAQHFPDDGWLSEENVDDKSRLLCDRVWIVDPIDGTREFTNGVPEYAISVALVENGQPIIGAIYNPATQEFFHAEKGAGAWLENTRLHCRRSCDANRLTLLASRSEYARGEWDKFAGKHELKALGSIAYKMALIASGKADATFSLGPKNEWDIAAGVLLVEEAGGVVTNKHGAKIIFNQENVLVDGIVATAKEVNSEILRLIK